jgi:hypothetical protein
VSISPPLTERVLRRLGRPRWLWITLWSASSFFVYELTRRLATLPTYPGIAYSVMSAYGNFVGLTGAALLWLSINDAREPVEKATGTHRPFELVGWLPGPLLLSLLTTATWTFTDFVRYPSWATAWVMVAQYVAWLPGNTGLWVYAVIASDLYQLGRRPLRFKPFEEDRSLGLRPVGTIASRAILMISIGAIPLAAAGVKDPRSFIALLVVFAAAIMLMMAALWPIHAQMVAVKTQTLRRARQLAAESLRPVTASWAADALVHQTAALQAAEQVERRAAAIQEWPFDETILARIAAILTAVTATILARLVLTSFGL